MKISKPILNYRQQKIKLIVQIEKENGYDLTKKELIDKIRQILEQDYQEIQLLKEKELREKEFLRVRKLRIDGKLTIEDETPTSHHHDETSKQIVPCKEEDLVFSGTFQRNPTHSYRNNSNARSSNEEYDKSPGHKKSYSERREIKDSKAESTNENFKKDNRNPEREEKVGKLQNENDKFMDREKSELTLALENEDSLEKLFELAEKMVSMSSKK